jgi:hypothetical protein
MEDVCGDGPSSVLDLCIQRCLREGQAPKSGGPLFYKKEKLLSASNQR